MKIEDWYKNPSKFSGNNFDAWIMASEVITNLYNAENGLLEEKITYFESAKEILEQIYIKYKISNNIKFDNEMFLDDFKEKNIVNHIKNNIEKCIEKYMLIQNIPYEQKLNIWSEKREKTRRKSLAEILQGVEIYSSQNEF